MTEETLSMLNRIIKLVENNEKAEVIVKTHTVKFNHHNGWRATTIESWHTDPKMSKLGAFGYTPLAEFEDRVLVELLKL